MRWLKSICRWFRPLFVLQDFRLYGFKPAFRSPASPVDHLGRGSPCFTFDFLRSSAAEPLTTKVGSHPSEQALRPMQHEGRFLLSERVPK